MPETLFGEAGVLRGRLFNFKVDLRTPVSMTKQGSTNIHNEHGSWTLSTRYQEEQGEDEEMRNGVTQDEIFPKVQQFRRGEGKGKGKGSREHAGTVDESDHHSTDCPNKATAGQMVEHGEIRDAARQAKTQAKDEEMRSRRKAKSPSTGDLGTVHAAEDNGGVFILGRSKTENCSDFARLRWVSTAKTS